MESLDFESFDLYTPSKPCPVASLFNAEQSIALWTRRSTDASSSVCSMVKETCCQEVSFMNLKSLWNEGAYPVMLMIQSYVTIFEFFSNSFIHVGVMRKPSYTHECRKTPNAMKACVEQYENLKTHSKEFTKSFLPKLREMFKKSSDMLMSTRTKLFCMSCDPSSGQYIDVAKKSINITRVEFEKFARATTQDMY